MTKYLWLVERADGDFEWDEYSALVVCATKEAGVEALLQTTDEWGCPNYRGLHGDRAVITEIGVAAEHVKSGVVCEDYVRG